MVDGFFSCTFRLLWRNLQKMTVGHIGKTIYTLVDRIDINHHDQDYDNQQFQKTQKYILFIFTPPFLPPFHHLGPFTK